MANEADGIQLTLTLKMTMAQVVQKSVTVNNNSPIQDYIQQTGINSTYFTEAIHPDIFCDWLSDYMTSFKEWVSQQKSDNLHESRSFGRMLSINEKN